MTVEVIEAFYSLRELTECRCHEDYKRLGRTDPECNHDYREDVDALQAELVRLNNPEPLAMSMFATRADYEAAIAQAEGEQP